MIWPWSRRKNNRQEKKMPNDELLDRFQRGRLDYAYFRLECEQSQNQHLLHTNPFAEPVYSIHDDPQLNEVLKAYSRQYAWDLACELSPEQFKRFEQFQNIAGAKFLLKACEYIERFKIPSFSYKDTLKTCTSGITTWGERTLAGVVRDMATISRLDNDDDAEGIVAQLRSFRPTTLLLVFPYATPADTLLLRALNIEHLIPLWLYVKGFCRYTPCSWATQADVQNSADPIDGVIDVPALRALLADDGERLLKDFSQFLKKAKISLPNTLQMLESFMGWNRESILQKIAKRNQPALKACGLLPLTGEDECLERYLMIKQFARESKQFGPQRQTTEQAAAAAALTNMAQIAGYPDTTRLEWAMEARMGSDTAMPMLSCAIGEYTATIELGVDGAPIIAFRNGQPLKSVPAVLRKEKAYIDLKETQTLFHAQGTRIRETLEKAMAEGQMLTAAEIHLLERMPMACPFLSRLVFLVDDTIFALYDTSKWAFFDIAGRQVPSFSSIRLAHPWHLYQASCLSDWQREIVQQHITQPFKQVFRELYLLTPAEVETGVYSTRFAGHVLNSGVVTRLFQARNWQTGLDEFSIPCKPSPAFRIDAYFNFPDAGHYLSETESLTSDTIYFLPRGKQWYQEIETDYRLPLQDIPPLLLSEIMRDADLIVSVGQRDGEAIFSAETYQRRGEVITNLMNTLALPGVDIDGHFVRVQGKLARYRVHLGSAAIHIEPGHYLCVVPDRWGKSRDKIYLPFTDADDSKLSEVISKVFLLMHDDTITDQSIVSQIKANR